MNGLLARISSRLYRIWFACCYRWMFKKLGAGSALFRPFRLDGGDEIVIGDGTVFQRGAWLYCSGVDGRTASLSVGDGCVFGYNNHITAVGQVVIENHVLTANNVYISDNLHSYEDVGVPIMHQPVKFKREVVIGSGSWIGENACIIGARIGKQCVIGANAVVTSDIPDYSVAAGVPARIIRQFDPNLKKWVTK